MSKKKTIGSPALFVELREETYIIRRDEEGKISLLPAVATLLAPPETLRDRGSFAKAYEEHVESLRREYERNGEKLPDISPLFSLKVVDDIPGIDKEKDLLKFSEEEMDILLDYFGEFSVREAPLPTRYKTPRETSIQMTRPRLKGEDLYDILSRNAETKEEGEQWIRDTREREGELLSTSSPGFSASVLEYKVVKAIQLHLFKQSEGYKTGEGGGIPPGIIKREGIPLTEGCIYVYIDPKEITRDVMGRDSLGGADYKRVSSALNHLNNKFYYDDIHKGFFPVFRIEKITLEGKVFLSVKKLFTEGLKNNFINTRSDELQRLAGINSEISIRLFERIKEMESRRTPTQQTGGYIDFTRTTLLERIAISKSYDKNPKRREEDFKKAIEDVKQTGIITKHEDKGRIVRFYINPLWREDSPEGRGR